MEGFLVNSLKHIRKDSGRKHKDLREACSATLAKLDTTLMPQRQSDAPADQYFMPLKLALESRSSRIISTALDCIEKLVAYGYLRGAGPPPPEFNAPASQKTLMEMVVQCMCTCKDHDDNAVHLQLLKALLTTVQSQYCEVHETTMLNAVRACYHIHLVSKSKTNRDTAKITLTQILNFVFQRMETYDLSNKRENDEISAATVLTRAIAAVSNIENEVQPEDTTVDNNRVDDSESVSDVDNTSSANESEEEDEGQTTNDPFSFDSAVYPGVLEVLGLEAASTLSPPFIIKEATSKGTNGSKTPTEEAGPVTQFHFSSLWHKDAFLLFRALCKLSMKHDDVVAKIATQKLNGGVDPIALKSKVLSLDLLLSVLDNSGTSFRSSDMFIFAIKQYLTTSLIKNCVSSNTDVVGLSLRIFVTLQEYFKDDLKAEIELFIAKIFVKILESPYSPREHKILVLEVFMRICKDVNTLVGIFINYDCDWDSMDLFSRTVQVLTRIATKEIFHTSSGSTGASTAGEKAAAAAGALHVMALDSMTSILRSLGEFTHLEDQLPGVNEALSVLDTENDDAFPGENFAIDDEVAGVEGEENGGSAVISFPQTSKPGDAMSVSDMASEAGGGGAHAQKYHNQSHRKSAAAVDLYQQKRKFNKVLTQGATKFNIKPKRGIQFLVNEGLVADEPEAIARLLLTNRDVFSKTMIGEYMGEGDEKNVAVMHAYVDLFVFADMSIDEALRAFLNNYRLPGEAQKIDRIMEKFAEHYCVQNPTEFHDNTAAYVLAFAIIMLNTDAHNPNIKPERKMSKTAFIRMTSDCQRSEAAISGVYDRIVGNAIALKEDDDVRERELTNATAASSSVGGLFSNDAALERQMHAAYTRERTALVSEVQTSLSEAKKAARVAAATGGQVLKKKKTSGDAEINGLGGDDGSVQEDDIDEDQYEQDDDDGDSDAWGISTDHVRPMFEVVWGPMLAIFSVNLQKSDDPTIVTMSIFGMQTAIRIAARFDMADECRTLVESLAKFCFLDYDRALASKHVQCIKALLELALHEGDYLSTCWDQVLLCTSQVARMHLFGSGGERLGDEVFFAGEGQQEGGGMSVTGGSVTNNSNDSSSFSSSFLQRKPSTSAFGSFFSSSTATSANAELARLRTIEVENSLKVGANISSLLVDRIFLNSVQLSTNAIEDFVTALCQVSLAELHLPTTRQLRSVLRPRLDTRPRIFSLQRLVEVADFNMTIRPRFVWSRIWAVLSRHFATAGCHENVNVSLYAIDSLRQLSMKFLQKDELSGFDFQVRFLRPFEEIMRMSQSVEQRELVVSCLNNMVMTKAHNIRSGWHSILSVVAMGAADHAHSIVVLAFNLLKQIVDMHFDKVEHPGELTACCMTFAANQGFEGESLRALALMRVCIKQIIVRHVVVIDDDTGSAENDVMNVDTLEELSEGDEVAVNRDEVEEENPVGSFDEDVLNYPVSKSRTSSASSAPSRVPRLRVGVIGNELMQVWQPLFASLANCCGDFRVKVRNSAMDTLFDTLQNYAKQFDPAVLVGTMEQTVLPMFANVLQHGRRFRPPQVPSKNVQDDGDKIMAENDLVVQNKDRSPSGQFSAVSVAGSPMVDLQITPVLVAVMLDVSQEWDKSTLSRAIQLIVFTCGVWYIQPAPTDTDDKDKNKANDNKDNDKVTANGTGNAGVHAKGRGKKGKSRGKKNKAKDIQASSSNADAPAAADGDKSDEEWQSTMRELFESSVLPAVLGVLRELGLRDVDTVARSAVWGLHELLEVCGQQMDVTVWQHAFVTLKSMVKLSSPAELQSTFTHKWVFGDSSADAVDTSQTNGISNGGVLTGVVVSDDETASQVSNESDGSANDDKLRVITSANNSLSESTTSSSGVGSKAAAKRQQIAANPATDTNVETNTNKRKESLEPDDDIPNPLPTPGSALPFEPSRVLTMCVVQLQLIRVIGDVVSGDLDRIGEPHVMMALNMLEDMTVFAKRFNDDTDLRAELVNRGFMRVAGAGHVGSNSTAPGHVMHTSTGSTVTSQATTPISGAAGRSRAMSSMHNKPPNLLRQETLAMANLLQCLIHICASAPKTFNKKTLQACEQRLCRLMTLVVKRFLYQDRVLTAEHTFYRPATTSGVPSVSLTEAESERYLRSFSPVVVQVLRAINAVDVDVLRPWLTWLLPLATGLIECASRDIHATLRHVLDRLLPMAMSVSFKPLSDDITEDEEMDI